MHQTSLNSFTKQLFSEKDEQTHITLLINETGVHIKVTFQRSTMHFTQIYCDKKIQFGLVSISSHQILFLEARAVYFKILFPEARISQTKIKA